MILPLVLTAVLSADSIALPGHPPVTMDYLAYEHTNHRIWVPAGNSGQVDVVDIASGQVTPITGFATLPRPGHPDMGPSSATVGNGVVWIGNRGDNRVCPFDTTTLRKGLCIQLSTMPDGLAYVASTREIWVTTPHDQTLTLLDVGSGKVTASLKLKGEPEGYAVDQEQGVFYTNLEDKNRTLAVDVKTRRLMGNWAPGCNKDGPRGLALDSARHLLMVACTDGAVVLDVAHEGKVVGHLKTGGGVDNLDYSPDRRLLYVASSKDGTLTIASLADNGTLTTEATAPTAPGARNPVVDSYGVAYVPDALGARLIVIGPSAPH